MSAAARAMQAAQAPWSERLPMRYRWLRWRMGRARSRFDVYSGGKAEDDEWKSCLLYTSPSPRDS